MIKMMFLNITQSLLIYIEICLFTYHANVLSSCTEKSGVNESEGNIKDRKFRNG